jgi:hypothetical protein
VKLLRDAFDLDYFLGICLYIDPAIPVSKPVGNADQRKIADFITKFPGFSIFSLVFCRDLRMIALIREIFKQKSELLVTLGTLRA